MNGLMADVTKVDGKIIAWMVKVYTLGKMEESMKENI